MTPNRPLADIAVLVTRPAGQAAPLCRMIEGAGGTAIGLPLIALRPETLNDSSRAAVAELTRDDLAIFISSNAVRFMPAEVRERLAGGDGPRVLAVGAATFGALAEAGIQPVSLPPDMEFSSEGLLRLPVLDGRRIAGRNVAIFRGVGGRELLAETLGRRGASVVYVQIYRREPATPDIAAVTRASGRPDFTVITSGETLERLAELVRTQRQDWLFDVPLVLISRRLAIKAAELGFTHPPHIAGQASDTGVLEAIIRAASPAAKADP